MSTVSIVPFLMFALVTTNAAVAEAAETEGRDDRGDDCGSHRLCRW